MKTYKYVGPPELLEIVGKPSNRRRIQNQSDISEWICYTNQRPSTQGEIIVTFIIDVKGDLWITNRHSEHVVCANGGPVLSAGEMTFYVTSNSLEVSAVTNQSTGFCPEPESWSHVAKALDKIDLVRPESFTTEFSFRRCAQCDSINLVKEDWFICSVCDSELDEKWNLA